MHQGALSEADVSSALREVRVALPAELTHEARVALVRDFAQAQFVDRGMVADVALHAPGREGDERTLAAARREGFGYVLQSGALAGFLTVRENILCPLLFAGRRAGVAPPRLRPYRFWDFGVDKFKLSDPFYSLVFGEHRGSLEHELTLF